MLCACSAFYSVLWGWLVPTWCGNGVLFGTCGAFPQRVFCILHVRCLFDETFALKVEWLKRSTDNRYDSSQVPRIYRS